jgi:hypothetical protein
MDILASTLTHPQAGCPGRSIYLGNLGNHYLSGQFGVKRLWKK